MIGQDAINRDPAWFAEHVKKTPKGAPLAYDPRLVLRKRNTPGSGE